MSELRVITAIPHTQFSGDHCAFFQFDKAPSDKIRMIIKETGGVYRKGPTGKGKGWHHKDPGALARAIDGHWPSFANRLRGIRRSIKHMGAGDIGSPPRVGKGTAGGLIHERTRRKGKATITVIKS